jgi:endonuclease/exonuclease/phosphatase family metal-dependent hydrolase
MRTLIALLVCLIAALPAGARELKLAVWNLGWLTRQADLPPGVAPKRAEDIATLRGYARALKADVVAFAGVDGPEIAAEVFPPDLYRIHITADQVIQRTGFAIARDLPFTAHADLTALDVYPNARLHLRSAADITLDLPAGRLRLLAVHLKSGCGQDDRLDDESNPACRTLSRQIAPLQAWIAQRQQEGEAFVLMGDFNRWMAGRDPFFDRLQQAAPLLRADAGLSSTCWGGGGFLDHLLVGGGARPWLALGSLRELVYRETNPAMKQRLSAHCPVSARFALPDALASRALFQP